VTYVIRAASPADLPGLAALCAAHAQYELAAAPPPPEAVGRLREALFGAAPRAYCTVVEHADQLVGFASYSPEFSTWQGRDYLHLDCLYLESPHRRAGLGSRLLAAAIEQAQRLGYAELQWQTPEWNAGAIAFYERHGARSKAKLRFSLPITAPREPQP
jgi:GNAT superfamily N-acetyltransferase